MALERYEKYINLHEPFEETLFEHVIKNSDIKTFIDVGSAWGYYSLLAKKLNNKIKVIGFDSDKNMINNSYKNGKLNNITDIDFRYGGIPKQFKLSELIAEVKQIDLIKIDIQGAATDALKSADKDIVKIKNVILGTHGTEHDDCHKIFKDYGFDIKLDLKNEEIPIQPDGILWAQAKND